MAFSNPASLGQEILQARDPELLFLASEAAIDIDNLLLGKPARLKSMQILGSKLRFITPHPSDSQPRALMDLATFSVLCEAVAKVSEIKTAQKIEDLNMQVSRIAKLLSSEKPNPDCQDLEMARDFCIALSKALMDYRMAIRDMRPSHPFRK